MFTAGAEQNRHEKGNDGAKADPPRKFRASARTGIKLSAEKK